MPQATELIGRTVTAQDGDVGSVEDLYFDDERWVVRYLVVRCTGWLDAKLVLLSPASVKRDDVEEARIRVDLSREQIRNGPDADTERPVSRRFEAVHATYYGYPYYWRGPELWGTGIYPGMIPMPLPQPGAETAAEDLESAMQEEREAAERSHLRSAREVVGYRVHATDGDAGTLDDLQVDDRTWAVTHLVVDAKPWWPGGRVHVAPGSVRDIDWAERQVRVAMTREALKAGTPLPAS